MHRVDTLQSHLNSGLPIKVHPDVARALKNGDPVVALESTIISHGMPYPENVQCARGVEDVVRKNGATPATVAILSGVIHVGLTSDELELFGKLGPAKIRKCSRRDMPLILGQRLHGATTVSATMMVAHMAGIPVFVTGGVGGVHRGGEHTMDVSADLTELGRTPVCVVSAGVKSILDIPRTLEVLETQGTTVMVLGADEFPAFFTRKSGAKAPMRVDTTAEAATVVGPMRRLGLSGAIVAVPIPAEHEADGEIVAKAIDVALAEAAEKKVLGNDITPFLLKRVNELTQGRSLKSNIALVMNNARVGAEIAVAHARLERGIVA
eukprot:PhM_4_TR1176/c0_g1_i1/m.14205/K16329/psuG; pseudouridylate synthase